MRSRAERKEQKIVSKKCEIQSNILYAFIFEFLKKRTVNIERK